MYFSTCVSLNLSFRIQRKFKDFQIFKDWSRGPRIEIKYNGFQSKFTISLFSDMLNRARPDFYL